MHRKNLFTCGILYLRLGPVAERNPNVHGKMLIRWDINRIRPLEMHRTLTHVPYCIQGVDEMEIYDKQDKGYIEVWMTNEEQQICDRDKLKDLLLSDVKQKKCRVVFFLSGKDNLYQNTEGLLLMNLKYA